MQAENGIDIEETESLKVSEIIINVNLEDSQTTDSQVGYVRLTKKLYLK